MKLKTLAAIVAIVAVPLGAWIDMRVAVARLQDGVGEIDRRLSRIERSVYGVARNDAEGP